MNSPIQARAVSFNLTKEIPRHWNSGDPVKTHFLNAFSVLLPAYEQFFIKTIHKEKNRVTSKSLQAEITGFCAQEGVHASEHRKYNQMLLKQGYAAIPTFEKLVSKLLQFAQKKFSRDFQLSLTAGGEHVTSFMGRDFLDDEERWQVNCHPEMKALWQWHAAEELEHKNVCFDVFENVRGGQWFRILGFFAICAPSLFMMSAVFFYLLFKDGLLFEFGLWKNYFKFMWGREGYMRRLFEEFRIYSRKNFHPSQTSDLQLIEEVFSY